MKKKTLVTVAYFMAAMLFVACEKADTCKFDETSGVLSCVEKSYKTVKVGETVWMAENLMRFDLGGESFCYNDTLKNCYSLGALYPHKVAMEICPEGWMLPSKADFEKAKMASPEMRVIKAGFRYYDGKYADENATASFLTADVYDDSRATLVRINANNEVVYENFNKSIATSVRCIRKN